MKDIMEFYKGKRVLITGHTGFKGSWLCQMLLLAGAEVYGYALQPPTDPNLFTLLELERHMDSVIANIQDFDTLQQSVQRIQPEIIFHLAAQPIVKEGYRDPISTYHTNVMGTVHLLESVRHISSVKSVVNITTDKVYNNREWAWGYRETDGLDGYDPYSNSKSCSELVTHCYIRSFLQAQGVTVSTARAGNVIGGGDFAPDRILPDCIRNATAHKPIVLRNPNSVRPYQHVLEPLSAYLLLAKRQYEQPELAGSYNVGPAQRDCITTGQLADLFCQYWGDGVNWIVHPEFNPVHETNFLRLDCSKIQFVLGWLPQWTVEKAIAATVEWTRGWQKRRSVSQLTNQQIKSYLHI